jgi:hypothetical protein
MTRYLIVLLFFMISFTFTYAFSHGEDKPGPHGGFIKMPGAFHTEIVVAAKNSVKIYLLDINWKNPSVAKSKLETRWNDGELAKCSIEKKKYYLCAFASPADLTQPGKMTVKAERAGQSGALVTYDFPLKLGAGASEHSGH